MNKQSNAVILKWKKTKNKAKPDAPDPCGSTTF